MSDEAIPEDAKTNYAKSPAAIRAVAESIAELYRSNEFHSGRVA